MRCGGRKRGVLRSSEKLPDERRTCHDAKLALEESRDLQLDLQRRTQPAIATASVLPHPPLDKQRPQS